MSLILDLWKQSCPIDRAAEFFAQKVYPDEWKDAVQHRGTKHFLENVVESAQQQSDSSGKTGLELLGSSFEAAAGREKPKLDLLDRATAKIIRHLRAGSYRAYGFDRPRTVDTIPVLLPQEVWAVPHSLSKTTVQYQSLTFTDVRLRMAKEADDPLIKEAFDTDAPKAGRPSVAHAVAEAFEELEKLGQIDITATKASHFPKVRTWLEESKIELSVPASQISDKTLHKYLSIPFNNLKKSR